MGMHRTNVVIVEDEVKLVSLLETELAKSFSVSTLTSYAGFAESVERATLICDVVVLDRMMNGHDTLKLLPALKSKFPQTHVLILSAINTPSEKATALDLGADDYLSKPYANEELVSRIKVLARRVPSEIRYGNIAIDVDHRLVTVGEETINLAVKEYRLLWALMRNPRKVFSKAELYQDVWQTNAEIESHSIETTVNKLRRKLEDAGARPAIRNSRNLGYWIEE
jgi:DNA-binding response OmpR family regulator